MFGYVRPCKAQLRICEYETYRGVYCGLCKKIGSEYGGVARLFLSNDLTFLALVHMSIASDAGEICPCKCFLHPFQKQFCFSDNPALDYAAGASMLLWYYKLRDTLSDKESLLKKLAALVLYPFAYFAFRKAKGLYPQLAEICGRAIQQQNAVEAARSPSLDGAAAPTAEGMSGLLSLPISPEHGQHRVLARLGYLVGRYIYLCDAAEDFSQDAKSGSYNPFCTAQTTSSFTPQDALYLTLGEIEKTYALLELQRFQPIVENILLLGLRQTADGILASKERA